MTDTELDGRGREGEKEGGEMHGGRLRGGERSRSGTERDRLKYTHCMALDLLLFEIRAGWRVISENAWRGSGGARSRGHKTKSKGLFFFLMIDGCK